MTLTEQQRRAVEHAGGDLLVSASAGSGKTSVMAERVARLLLGEPRCDVTELLVVTFTRDAAAELRGRVAAMLRERLSEPRPEAERAHLQRQLVLLDQADIGTIDAWCQRVLRSRSEAAGVDPGLRVLGDHEARLLRLRVMDEVFEELLGDDSPPLRLAADGAGADLGPVLRAWVAAQSPPDTFYLRNMVFALNRRRELLSDPQGWFDAMAIRLLRDPGAQQADLEHAVRSALGDELAFQTAQIDAFSQGFTSPGGQKACALYHDDLRAAIGMLAAGRAIDDVLEPFSGKRHKVTGVPDAERPVFRQLQEHWIKKRLRECFDRDKLAEQFAALPVAIAWSRALLALEAEFQRRLVAAKRERSLSEFGDVLRATLDLLAPLDAEGRRRPGTEAQRLQARYREVLVDEYQDTSPLQVELLRSVARGGAGPGNRFMVGDVKQSIYAFRQAEPRLFIQQRDDLRDGRATGRVQPLSANFRSHKRLLDGINAVCAMLFDSRLGGTHYGEDERLVAGRKEQSAFPDDGPRIEVDLIRLPARGHSKRDDDDDDDRDGEPQDEPLEQIEWEGTLIAARIHELMARANDGAAVSGDAAIKPLRLGEIVVLLRSAQRNAPNLAAALRKAGVPAVAAGRESLLDCPEVRDVLAVLALLGNRRQDIPMAAYLRGPMVGLSEAELLAIGRSQQVHFAVAATMLATSDANTPLASRVRTALQRLDDWSAAARREALGDLMRRVIAESNLRLFARGRPGAAHRLAMLDALQGLADEFARSQGEDAAGFVDQIERLQRESIQFAGGAAGGEDLVRVMTIHAAKGLEFPVVFVANSGAWFSRIGSDPALHVDDRFGVVFRSMDAPNRREVVGPGFQWLRRRERENGLEEELRLLYVAMTRAREKLFIVGHGDADLWENVQSRDRRGGPPPTLITRLSARHALEWVLAATAASDADAVGPDGPTVRVNALAAGDVSKLLQKARSTAEPEPPNASADRRWVETAQAYLATSLDRPLAQRPAVLSVSVLKRELAQAADAEHVATLDWPAPLARPKFAAEAVAVAGAEYGAAVHRFLEFVDWRAMAEAGGVAAECARLVRLGRLTEQEAAAVDAEDVAWLAASPCGQAIRAAGAAVRREVGFSWGLPLPGTDERVLVRGVIDCIVPEGEGLLIIDYKTDRPRDQAEFARRCALYGWQLRLYATALAAIEGRAVSRAVLAFLGRRELVDVSGAPLTGGELLAALDAGPSVPAVAE